MNASPPCAHPLPYESGFKQGIMLGRHANVLSVTQAQSVSCIHHEEGWVGWAFLSSWCLKTWLQINWQINPHQTLRQWSPPSSGHAITQPKGVWQLLGEVCGQTADAYSSLCIFKSVLEIRNFYRVQHSSFSFSQKYSFQGVFSQQRLQGNRAIILSLEMRRLQGILSVCITPKCRGIKQNQTLSEVSSKNDKRNRAKLKYREFCLNIRTPIFAVTVSEHRQGLPRLAADPPCLEILTTQWYTVLDSLH